MGATVRFSGPLFDGRAAQAVTDFADDFEVVLADHAIDNLRDGTRVFRYAGGKRSSFAPWRSRLESKRVSPGMIVSNPAIYTAWLEGVSSRNATTRFKGYHLFRQATQAVQFAIPWLASTRLPGYVSRMN